MELFTVVCMNVRPLFSCVIVWQYVIPQKVTAVWTHRINKCLPIASLIEKYFIVIPYNPSFSLKSFLRL